MFKHACIFRPENDEQRKEAIEWLTDIRYFINDNYTSEKFMVMTMHDENFAMFYDPYNLSLKYLNECYNCGSNLELFKALTAVRDDSDYMQWFVYDETLYDLDHNDEVVAYRHKGEFILCNTSKMLSSCVHKATKEEIIEWFKG